MSTKYKFLNSSGIYFISFAVVDWIEVFTRQIYKDIVVKSLKYCCDHKGMGLFAWCIMSNHIHLIFDVKENIKHGELIRDFKKFSSKELIKAIIKNTKESRKEWMLERFSIAGEGRSNVKSYQFWQQSNHPIEVFSPTVIAQKLDYIHLNPVKAGFVDEAHFYIYSSASNYYSGKGLIDVVIIDLPMSNIGYIRME